MAMAAARLLAERDEETAMKHKVETEHARIAAEEHELIHARAQQANKTVESEAARQALTKMTSELARLERALADLKAAREKEKNTYSVVPYNGKRGENRRPLYVECAAGELIFHPDHLSMSDARDAPEIQSEVERRLERQKQLLSSAQSAAFTPYLMLLVRPDGVLSYYHLRESLRGLKIEFGYEFIDKDWVLDFPADDQPLGPQPWAQSPKPADAAAPSASSLHVVGVPTHGQDGPPRPPSPPNPPSGASPGSNPTGGVAGNFTPHGVMPGRPSAEEGSDPGWHPSGPSTFGSSRGGSSGSGDALGLIPSIGAAGNSAPNGSQPGTPSGGAGAASGTEKAGAFASTPTDGSLRSGNAGSSAPPPPGPFLTPPPERSASASGGSPSGPPGTAVAAKPGTAAAPAPSDGSVALPELGPPRLRSGEKTDKTGETTGKAEAAATGPTDPPPPPSGTASRTGTGSPDGGGQGDDDPFLRATPTPKLPKAARSPAPLRPARLSGDRDWIVFVECKAEGVVVYPMRLVIPVSALAGPAGSNQLSQSVRQLIDRKQATVRPGDAPYRPEVRFLVHADAGRTFHMAYPTLDALAAPKTAQTLAPEDDAATIAAGH